MGLSRVAVHDDTVGGIRIPAGTSVGVLIYGIHQHPGVWENPKQFDPARFLPGASQPASRQATMPFGAGRRMCIASGFASLEAALIVAAIAQRFTLELCPQKPIRRENTFTGGPEGALWMELRTRRPALAPALPRPGEASAQNGMLAASPRARVRSNGPAP